MNMQSLNDASLYVLRQISFRGECFYRVSMARGSELIESICEVRKIESEKIGLFDLVDFQSKEFNDLCTRGHIYIKPISRAVLAFHECIYPDLGIL